MDRWRKPDMDGRMDEHMNGWKDRHAETDDYMDGLMEEWMDRYESIDN